MEETVVLVNLLAKRAEIRVELENTAVICVEFGNMVEICVGLVKGTEI